MFEFCLAERIRKFLENRKYFAFFQSAFRTGRSVEENLLFVDSLHRRCVGTQDEHHLGFVDMEVAFPSILRQLLLDLMERDGFSFLMCRILTEIFNFDFFSVLVNNRFGEFFPKNKGLVQEGSGLSPILFIFFYEHLRS